MGSSPGAATLNARWGLFGTTLWGVTIAVVFVITQTVAALVYISSTHDIEDPAQLQNLDVLAEDGDVLSVATLATFIVCGFLVFIAVASKTGANIRHYLALRQVSWRVYLAGFVAITVLMLTIEACNIVFARPMPESMVNSYLSADNKLWLWSAIVFAAPVFEEVFFRGFLHSGLERTMLGVTGAIIVTAGLWALVHIQYDAYEMFMIFIMGIVLGAARWLTGSIYVPILMHCINNFVSTLQLSYLSSRELVAHLHAPMLF